MQTTQALSASRFVRADLAALAVGGLAVAMLAVAGIFVAYRLGAPTDGASGGYVTSDWTAQGLSVATVDAPTSPLRAGDVVTGVAGVPLDDWLRGAESVRPDVRAGAMVDYGVVRDGRILTLPVTLSPYPLGAVLLANWGTLLWLLLMLGVAGYLFARRPHEPATQALLVLSSAIMGSTIPWMLRVGPPDLVAGSLGPVLYLVSAYLLYAVFWAAMVHFTLVFPRQVGGRRNRRLAWAAYGVIVGSQVAWVAGTYPGSRNLIEWIGSWSAGQLVMVPSVLVGVIGMGVFHWRTASAEERLRLRSFFAASIVSAGIALLGWYLPAALRGGSVLPWSAVGLAGLPFPIALAVTVRRGRLFGIETILRRSLVYGGLTATVVLVYATAFVLLSALLPGDAPYAVYLLATGVAALVALPLRDRLQRGVNHLLYGDRDEPHRALARLAQRLDASLEPEAVLPIVAQTVAESLRLPYAAIELQRDGGAMVAAAHGTPRGELERLTLVHGGEVIGWLAVAPRAPDEPFSAADRSLLADLARQAGAAAHSVRLTRDLQRYRQQLVSAREEERRRLRRDLHDGVGPTLAGALLKLEAARGSDPAAMDALLAELESETRRTIDDVRRLAYGLRPPVLDQVGLAGALRQDAERLSAAGPRITVEALGLLPDLPAAVEVAAYRIGCEAMTNVVHHASAAHASLTLEATPDALVVRITDDGRGMALVRHAGVGLTSMRERAEELGGEFAIDSNAAGGVRITARLPLPDGADA